MINQVAEASLNLMTQPIDNAIRALMPIKKASNSSYSSTGSSFKRTQEQLNVQSQPC